MRRFDKSYVIAVATIVLCFTVTLGLTHFYSGAGLWKATFGKKTKGREFYLVTTAVCEDISISKSTAELIKLRGGAGYVDQANGNRVVLAVYKTSSTAKEVLNNLKGNGVELFTVVAEDISLDFDADLRSACQTALGYFDLAFDGLNELSVGLAEGDVSCEDVKIKTKVLKGKIEDIRQQFYVACEHVDDEALDEIKLALITCLAIIDNVVVADKGSGLSSLRFAQVQLTYCYVALSKNLK